VTLTIELPADEVTALTAKARAQGVSAEEYARFVLENDIRAALPQQSVSERVREIWADMSPDERAELPRDGASQIDHYVYGLPKRDQ
jgi:hypothetical protein